MTFFKFLRFTDFFSVLFAQKCFSKVMESKARIAFPHFNILLYILFSISCCLNGSIQRRNSAGEFYDTLLDG